MATHDTATAYPLSWPSGWKRTASGARAHARFGRQDSKWVNPSGQQGMGWQSRSHRPLTIAQSRDRLAVELERLGARATVLSTNLELRIDGLPRGGQRAPDDPGAAVYFTLRKRPIVLACDKWDRVEDNIAAIAAHVAAMRGMERWGVGNVEQAFTGYVALPEPEQWWQVLGVPHDAPAATIRAAYKEKMLKAHPDRGGNAAEAARLNAAMDTARSSGVVA